MTGSVMLAESLWGNHGEGCPIVHAQPHWGVAKDTGVVEPHRSDGPAVAAVALVLIAEAALLYLLATRVVNIGTPAAAQAGVGPMRVRLVARQTSPVPTPPPVVEPVRQPEPKHRPEPKPQPQKKVVASKAPSPRVVRLPDPPRPAPRPDTQPAAAPVMTPPQHEAVTPVPPVTAPVNKVSAAAENSASTTDTNSGQPGSSVQAAPKEVTSLACEVPQPDYPRAARRRGQGGQVVVRLVVDEQGKVASARVVRGSGVSALDVAAREAALQASCDPYREAGRAIRVTASQLFNFVPTD